MDKTTKQVIQVVQEIEVPEGFVDYLTTYQDIFYTNHCGYWCYGYGVDDRVTGSAAWLVYELTDDEENPSDEECEEAAKLYATHKPLPEYWFALDNEGALKVLAEGVKRFGPDFYDKSDASTMDEAIQLALLGEHRYA